MLINRRRPPLPPPSQMLISGADSLPSSGSFGSGGGGCCSAPAASSPVLIWPGTAAVGVVSGAAQNCEADKPIRRRRGRSFATGSSARSDSALHAMSIPARCALPSVDLLREAYGHRRSFWGDLSPAETRRFYHELLPVSIRLEALAASGELAVNGKERPLGGGTSGGGLAAVVGAGAEGGQWDCVFGAVETLEQLARLASMSRHSARLYSRERSELPVRVASHLYDGLRHLKRYGSFR